MWYIFGQGINSFQIKYTFLKAFNKVVEEFFFYLWNTIYRYYYFSLISDVVVHG